MLFNKFVPDHYYERVFDIDLQQLVDEGIKGIITDLDNTLVPWDERSATEEVLEWLKKVEAHGLDLVIISNNNEERVQYFCEPLTIPYFSYAKKPLKRTFNRGAKKMNLKKSEVAVVGDQLLTDIFGGNRAGYKTILVAPIVESDAKITQFNRRIERFVLNRLRKQGKVSWED